MTRVHVTQNNDNLLYKYIPAANKFIGKHTQSDTKTCVASDLLAQYSNRLNQVEHTLQKCSTKLKWFSFFFFVFCTSKSLWPTTHPEPALLFKSQPICGHFSESFALFSVEGCSSGGWTDGRRTRTRGTPIPQFIHLI